MIHFFTCARQNHDCMCNDQIESPDLLLPTWCCWRLRVRFSVRDSYNVLSHWSSSNCSPELVAGYSYRNSDKNLIREIFQLLLCPPAAARPVEFLGTSGSPADVHVSHHRRSTETHI
ncbi:hypothetical protein MPTK1_6g10150 [Marchantia polymorpha subsp. ruderalis]|uniref:Uncharacterized protein n=2 Tax=Marchantia polymorpha TaxID=3197 RepID=A0AAF6BQH5_MARPO|nr:hypothetical protein MARPO_0016s0058 [Marchantia polymorpha]BBN14259.1 hypothetical protein Mp_6g10150 [Marchantia polymorpha subsp. ruderalis]|eukprot:PTQ44994.1 hypothetical protein MARPO_0016s0058 [Marchantia polymorpha]